MKRRNEFLQKTAVKAGSMMLAGLLVIGGSIWTYESQNRVPELVTYVDMDDTIQISEDEVPLAAPKVTKTTKTKKKTKKIKLKQASKKTYKKAGKTTTKTKTSRKKTKTAQTTTETVVSTKTTNQYKKGSKINTQLTVEKTVVTKTVAPVNSKTAAPAAVTAAVETKKEEAVAAKNGIVSVGQAAPKLDQRVASAFQKLGFRVEMNSGVSYSGMFDARAQKVVMRRADDTIYHEMGHFLAFIAGNADTSAEFQGIFSREKAKYTAANKVYVLSNSSEYFAESFKNYTLDPAQLQNSRPETYAAIQNALSKVTDAQVARIQGVYGAFWNK